MESLPALRSHNELLTVYARDVRIYQVKHVLLHRRHLLVAADPRIARANPLIVQPQPDTQGYSRQLCTLLNSY